MTYWQKFRIYQPFNPIAKSNYFLPAVPLTRVHTKILNFPRFTLCPLSLYMYPRALKIGNNSSDICLFYKHLFSTIIFVGFFLLVYFLVPVHLYAISTNTSTSTYVHYQYMRIFYTHIKLRTVICLFSISAKNQF